jgi:two-component system, OmpR family, sensor kinase
MRDSLHLRLVLWYALVLTLVVVLYGGAVVYQSWQSAMAGVDAELQLYAREVSKALKPVDGGRFDLELPSDAAAYFFRSEGVRPYYVIWSRSGELVDRSDPDLHVGLPGNTAEGRRELSTEAAGGALVLVGRDITDLQRAQRGVFWDVLIAGALTLAVAIFGGWFVAGRALAPIKRISRTARAMSAGDLNARIAVESTESELEQVASTLNEAFDRLRLAVEQERRFMADASHELRTPISVLRAETEWALDRDRSPQQYKDALTVCRRAAHRMQDIAERLLTLVRAEVAPDPQEMMPVAMGTLIEDVVGWLAPMAQERGVRMNVSGDPFTVSGDAEQLREALNNVIANAILYNREGGSVTISSRVAGGTARIEIVDTGIGIPADAVSRVFERFFRVDKARSREVGGSGLGLSIARAVFVAHGGGITCTSEPGVGSAFVISLPAVKSPDSRLAIAD